ncbi:MAG: hypothetical protein ACRDO1_13155 [Nocardioidaceae bacterium]
MTLVWTGREPVAPEPAWGRDRQPAQQDDADDLLAEAGMDTAV